MQLSTAWCKKKKELFIAYFPFNSSCKLSGLCITYKFTLYLFFKIKQVIFLAYLIKNALISMYNLQIDALSKFCH